MAKEINDIIAAFKEAQRQGRQTALATVVHVEGSSYRRPGARMLVEDNGRLTGAISGGCLEGDALRKALQAMTRGQNKLVTYNTLDEDDVQFGVQLGCNGIVHILFEPIDFNRENNPIMLLEQCVAQRKSAVLATLFSLQNFSGLQHGTCLFFNRDCTMSSVLEKQHITMLERDATTVLYNNTSMLKHYEQYGFSAFIELVEPPVALVIAGAGNDALPLVEMAAVLGWQTTVVDGRATHANRQRFSKAHQVIVGKPGEVMQQLHIDERTVFVLMTHNYNYDLEMLELLLQKECTYIGTLGPKKRLNRILSELEQNRVVVSAEQMATLHGPTGLDIGAETAEEIAVSILGEIKAVLAQRSGTFLKDRQDAIHARAATVMVEDQKA